MASQPGRLADFSRRQRLRILDTTSRFASVRRWRHVVLAPHNEGTLRASSLGLLTIQFFLAQPGF